jgi:hypothetical protein
MTHLGEIIQDDFSKKNLDSPSLEKGCLGLEFVTNWYHSMVTTLGLLGIMNESLKNVTSRNFRGDTLY